MQPRGDLEPGAEDRCAAVVIYEHELLGQGIAVRLREIGIRTCSVNASKRADIRAMLSRRPPVVVAETMTATWSRWIHDLTPTSRVVDISQVIGRGCQASGEMVHFEAILSALAAAMDTDAGC